MNSSLKVAKTDCYVEGCARQKKVLSTQRTTMLMAAKTDGYTKGHARQKKLLSMQQTTMLRVVAKTKS